MRRFIRAHLIRVPGRWAEVTKLTVKGQVAGMCRIHVRRHGVVDNVAIRHVVSEDKARDQDAVEARIVARDCRDDIVKKTKSDERLNLLERVTISGYDFSRLCEKADIADRTQDHHLVVCEFAALVKLTAPDVFAEACKTLKILPDFLDTEDQVNRAHKSR